MLLNQSKAFAGNREWVVSLKKIRQPGVIVQKPDISRGAATKATVFTYHFDDPATEREVAQGRLRQTQRLKFRYQGPRVSHHPEMSNRINRPLFL